MLRARALAVALVGERDVLARTIEDLRAFAPDDPVATQLSARSTVGKGSIEVRDLALR
jgi:hypothetical protein